MDGTRSWTSRRALLLLAMVVACAGCGGGSSSSSSGGPTGVVPVRVEAKDFRYQPNTLKGTVNHQVTVGFTNQGSVEHTFTISSADVAVDVDLKPGESRSVIFVPTAAGQLQFLCKFHGNSGMRGTVDVTPA
jgi:plastocyanin